MDNRVNIMWTPELDALVEKVVKKHAGKMGEAGLAPMTAVRGSGFKTPNRSAAIVFALMLAAGEIATPENPETVT